MFRTVPLSIMRIFSLYTQQWYISYSSVLILLASCHQTCMTHTIAVRTVKTDDVQRNCPKHVEFYSKNKFEKLVCLVGFIIGIYLDARSPERNFICVKTSYMFRQYTYSHHQAELRTVIRTIIQCNNIVSRFYCPVLQFFVRTVLSSA